MDKNSKKCVVAEGQKLKSGYKGWLLFKLTNNLCYNNLKDNDFCKCILNDSTAEHCSNCAKNYYLGHLDNTCTNIIGCELSENRIRCKMQWKILFECFYW